MRFVPATEEISQTAENARRFFTGSFLVFLLYCILTMPESTFHFGRFMHRLYRRVLQYRVAPYCINSVMDVNYELYKVFYHVAISLSFSEASKHLFISQSAVSQSIKVLEKKLGVNLFIRSTKRVQLKIGRAHV